MANESVNACLESNKKAATKGVYQKLSAEKKAEIGKRAAEHGVLVTVKVRAYLTALRANGTMVNTAIAIG